MDFKLITTSWDDGHPKDYKIAELLAKYGLQGTFYIPKTNAEHIVMREKEVHELSQHYEIGGHTLNHTRLKYMDEQTIETEVQGCYQWLEGVTGYQPISFCFPGGAINKTAIGVAKKSGFKILRTTELLCTALTSSTGLTPTTLQVYQHTKFTYLKHLLKRFRFNSILHWMKNGSSADLLKLLDNYIEDIEKSGGGCFHLWGHSWEIEEYNLWQKMETIFSHLSDLQGFRHIQNKDLLQHA